MPMKKHKIVLADKASVLAKIAEKAEIADRYNLPATARSWRELYKVVEGYLHEE